MRSLATGSREEEFWILACPVCRHRLVTGGETANCSTCAAVFERTAGIWYFLPPERLEKYERFLQEYATVRHREGWGRADSAYYRRLPYVEAGDPQRAIWRIRARNFGALTDRVVRPLEAERSRPLHMLDLGSGNGWLAYRLAERGNHVVAVDLSLDELDGLRASRWYRDGDAEPFISIQAEFDHLPLSSGQADIIVFNGSLHYTVEYLPTLTEARRVLRDDGILVILDTPVYRHGSSGEQMVREREAAFQRIHGFRSNTLRSENFLTWERLDRLAGELNLRWSLIFPYHGLGWSLRPLRAKLARRRPPAQLPVIVGKLH